MKQRRLFEAIEAQIAEITALKRDDVIADVQYGAEAERRHEAEMEKLAATEPSLEFIVNEQKVEVTYTNVKEVKMSMYRMDLEQLFSSNPFLNSGNAMSSFTSSFLFLIPNEQLTIELPHADTTATASHSIPLPSHLHHSNLLLSLSSGSLTLTKPHYSHSLAVSVMEAYGQLKVTAAGSNRPLSRVYVKVYAREGNRDSEGDVSFYKDGYTDWRGRFDYASLSTGRLGKVQRFALLLISEENGALVKEAKPPGKSS